MQTNNLLVSLQLKIIAGYVLLLIFLTTIVSLVRLEHQKMETLTSGEILIRQKMEAVNRTFEKLLDFSFYDDFLLLRDRDKFNEYRMKREIATTALNGLKRYYASDVQQTQIDTISSLLQEKRSTVAWSGEYSFGFTALRQLVPAENTCCRFTSAYSIIAGQN